LLQIFPPPRLKVVFQLHIRTTFQCLDRLPCIWPNRIKTLGPRFAVSLLFLSREPLELRSRSRLLELFDQQYLRLKSTQQTRSSALHSRPRILVQLNQSLALNVG
jgi:hypothetical protein